MPIAQPQQQAQPLPGASACHQCRSPVHPGSVSCGYCGARLGQPGRQPASIRQDGKKPGNPALKILGNVVAGVLAVVVAGLLFIQVSPDYDMLMVRSESMVPAINMGDLIINGPVPAVVNPGTVVTYESGQASVTHRVIEVKGGGLVTKGDAVEDPDPSPIAMSKVKGVYLFKIPGAGYLANFIRTKFGWFLIVVVPGILLLGLILYEIVKEVLKVAQRRLYTDSYADRR